MSRLERKRFEMKKLNRNTILTIAMIGIILLLTYFIE